MTTKELIAVILSFALAAANAFAGILHFGEKGFLLNNAYLWASKAERDRMDKKPHYRQSAILFCFLSTIFLVIGLSILLQNDKIRLVEIPLLCGAVIYAIVSSIRIEKQTKR